MNPGPELNFCGVPSAMEKEDDITDTMDFELENGPFYLCDTCPKAFASKIILQSHQRNAHYGEKDCKICQK